MKQLLHTEGLSVGHGRRPLLEGLALQLNAGTVTALLGANGSGKSTLLRSLAGLHKPLAGQVLVEGRAIAGMSAAERARAVSVVLTGRASTAGLDVRSLVALGRGPWTGRWGTLAPADRSTVEAAIVDTGCEALAARSVVSLSDGEYQRVQIARALAQATPVILLDEPTAFLDLPGRVAIVRLLVQVAREHQRAVLFSTHDLQLALDLCDGLQLLVPGEGLRTRTTSEALNDGSLQAAFPGTGVHFDPVSGTHRYTSG